MRPPGAEMRVLADLGQIGRQERIRQAEIDEPAAIDARIALGMETTNYDIPSHDGARLAWLYQHGEVVERSDDDGAVHLKVRLLPADRARFERQPAVASEP